VEYRLKITLERPDGFFEGYYLPYETEYNGFPVWKKPSQYNTYFVYRSGSRWYICYYLGGHTSPIPHWYVESEEVEGVYTPNHYAEGMGYATVVKEGVPLYDTLLVRQAGSVEVSPYVIGKYSYVGLDEDAFNPYWTREGVKIQWSILYDKWWIYYLNGEKYCYWLGNSSYWDGPIGYFIPAGSEGGINISGELVVSAYSGPVFDKVLQHTPAHIFQRLLIQNGFGSNPSDSTGNTPIYVSFLPDDVNEGIALYNTVGIGEEKDSSGEQVEHYGVQIRIRSGKEKDGWLLGHSIKKWLDSIMWKEIEIDNTIYWIMSVRCGLVNSLGIEPETKRKFIFTINVVATIKMETFVF